MDQLAFLGAFHYSFFSYCGGRDSMGQYNPFPLEQIGVGSQRKKEFGESYIMVSSSL